MTTWELHITGRVQGVGFRPHVYRLARTLGLRGEVRNGNDGVRVILQGAEAQITEFCARLSQAPPALAWITGTQLREIRPAPYTEFSIKESEEAEPAALLLSPDFAICPDCREELSAPNNRRYRYAFNTCTNCGPRYSILRALPYDRPRTTMAPFGMCPSCRAEYTDPEDRRYFSQTNSCPDCAVQLVVLNDQTARTQEAILGLIKARWAAGEIVAIKGIGGFLLTCSARDQAAVQRLRQRKYRPDKPLALLYPGLAEVQVDFHTSPQEAAALVSPEAPIVLLQPREKTGCAGIAPGLQRLGIMLPYAPLFQLLLQDYGHPIVATSGNRSGEPIVYQDTEAAIELADIADLIVGNNRAIVIPQDDSVVTHTDTGRRIILRRARGMAPTFLPPDLKLPATEVFAAGADLKSTFCFYHAGNIYLSQYLGDQDSFSAQTNYQFTRDHLRHLLGAKPKLVLTDLHPGYSVTEMGQALAEDLGIPRQSIQHHEAHFAAVLGEHNLLTAAQPILGVIWDGTGLGHDGQLWGGEFFRYAAGAFTRVHHLPYLPVLAGDKMAREPRLAALALAGDDPEALALLAPKFTTVEWAYYRKLRQQATLHTSSMGRLFDAVACLLGIGDTQSYEGMVASRLEAVARSAKDLASPPEDLDQALLPALLTDLRTCGPAQTAFRFHLRLVHLIRRIAEQQGLQDIAFSGGVFQNALLVSLLEAELEADYHLFFHEQLPPNDENIAFGQLIHHAIGQQRIKLKQTNHVLSNSR